DENLPIPGTHVTGGVVMAKIWRQYNEGYYKVFPTPPGSFIAPTIRTAPRPQEKLANEGTNVLTSDSVQKDKSAEAVIPSAEETADDTLKEQTPVMAPEIQTPSVTLTPSATTPAPEEQGQAKAQEIPPVAPTRLVPAPSGRLVPAPASK